MGNKRGLYEKYLVMKHDTGKEIDGAMVLVPGKDKHAQVALLLYATSISNENPKLSKQIVRWMENINADIFSPNDKLQELFDKQKQLMEVLGMSIDPVPDILDSPLFKDILICAVGEAAEALEPLAVTTKPWKHAEDKDAVREHIKEEIVDILFFVLELFIMAGMSPDDVMQSYTTKQQKNLIRAAGRSKSAEVASVGKWDQDDVYIHYADPSDPTPQYQETEGLPPLYVKFNEDVTKCANCNKNFDNGNTSDNSEIESMYGTMICDECYKWLQAGCSGYPQRKNEPKNPNPDRPLGANLNFYQNRDYSDKNKETYD